MQRTSRQSIGGRNTSQSTTSASLVPRTHQTFAVNNMPSMTGRWTRRLASSSFRMGPSYASECPFCLTEKTHEFLVLLSSSQCTAPPCLPTIMLVRFPESKHHAAKLINAQVISSCDTRAQRTSLDQSAYERTPKTENLTRTCLETTAQVIFR